MKYVFTYITRSVLFCFVTQCCVVEDQNNKATWKLKIKNKQNRNILLRHRNVIIYRLLDYYVFENDIISYYYVRDSIVRVSI